MQAVWIFSNLKSYKDFQWENVPLSSRKKNCIQKLKIKKFFFFALLTSINYKQGFVFHSSDIQSNILVSKDYRNDWQ